MTALEIVEVVAAWVAVPSVLWFGTGVYVQRRARRRAQRHAGTIGRDRVGL